MLSMAKKGKAKEIVLSLLLFQFSSLTQGLEAIEDAELSGLTGAGIGIVMDDVSFFSEMPGRSDPFELRLVLQPDDLSTTSVNEEESFVLKELSLHRHDFVPGGTGYENSGGRIGNLDNPMTTGDLVQVSSILTDGSGDPQFTYTAMHTEFPGGDLTSETITDEKLNELADKFDLHVQVNSYLPAQRGADLAERFDFDVDLKGFQFYGFKNDIWAIPQRGVAIASTVGIVADQLSLGGNPDGYAAGQLNLNGINIYLANGTPDQPMVIGTTEVDGKEQLVIEILPITKELAAAYGPNTPKSNISIKSIDFGDPYDPDLRTALKPGGDPNNKDDYYYAFQPEIGNVLEIKGLEVQHMKITTLDI